LSDFVEKRKLPRIEVRWPVTLITEKGSVEGEARNIAVERVFIHCMERLSLSDLPIADVLNIPFEQRRGFHCSGSDGAFVLRVGSDVFWRKRRVCQ